MTKMNCWEYKKCGTEKNCPAYPLFGKICYTVTGTLCKGEVQGNYQKKINRCKYQCGFYKILIGD